MRNLLAACALLFASAPAWAGRGVSFDVAPTTLDLASGKPGLFFISNHGKSPVKVQLRPMDWRQDASGDVKTPSSTLLVSPQFATIAPGARQSIRVLARPAEAGEHAYRLMVSELPDTAEADNSVHVLMQFSVPVFVDHDRNAAPALAWEAANVNGKSGLVARNQGLQTVKLTGLTLNGIPQGNAGFFYLLPGAAREFSPLAAAPGMQVNAHDERSNDDIHAVVTAR